MRSLLCIAIALAATAAAQDARRVVSPIAIQGSWLGAPGAAPTDCAADGFIVGFGTNNGQTFLMTVQHRVDGVAPLDGRKTSFKVVEPPVGAPLRLEVFLSSPDSEIAIDVVTGSRLELVPAGPDKSYGQTSLFLTRCA